MRENTQTTLLNSLGREGDDLSLGVHDDGGRHSNTVEGAAPTGRSDSLV